MFGKTKAAPSFARTLVGEWRAETVSGEVTSAITAIFNEDGSFVIRNQMDVRGARTGPVMQAGRYRVEAVDRQRFRLHTIDENGAPTEFHDAHARRQGHDDQRGWPHHVQAGCRPALTGAFPDFRFPSKCALIAR